MGVDERNVQKTIFAVPNEREGGRSPGAEEEVWGSSLKEWKDVANTQGFYLRFASDKVGTDKKEKEIN